VQNVAFEWADGTAGTVNALLNWANSGLLLLVFGPLATTDLQRLRQLSRHAPVRCVQVLTDGRGQARQGQVRQSQAREHVLDPHGVLASACHLTMSSPAAGGKPAQSRLVWALIRPDGYLAAHGEKLGGALVQTVGQALGLSTFGASV
jgi:3-(3-hydroxy-phenyl)propionate hydroxylase